MRAEDEHAYTFDRSDRAVVMRTGTITAVGSRTASTQQLANLPVLNMSGVVVGAKVLILLDRDSAVIVGAYGAP